MIGLLLDLCVKLCAIDNIASLARGLDEDAKKDWDPINQCLIDLRFARISTILLHHDNKAGGQRGTSARTDNLDYVIQLKQDPCGRYLWTFQNIKGARKREVVRLLDEGQKNKDIAAAVGYSAGQVSKIRTWAINGGLLSKAGKLSPSGFEWLSKA